MQAGKKLFTRENVVYVAALNGGLLLLAAGCKPGAPNKRWQKYQVVHYRQTFERVPEPYGSNFHWSLARWRWTQPVLKLLLDLH